MASRILLASSSAAARSLLKPSGGAQRLTPTRLNHKGTSASPPMVFTSVGGHALRFVFYLVVILSYPTYVMYNVPKWGGREPSKLNPEVQAMMDERAERRARGEHIPVVDPDWIKWINERDAQKKAAAEAAASQ